MLITLLALAAPAAANAAACGSMGFGQSAGSVSVEAFVNSVKERHAQKTAASKVEYITFGLG